MPDGGMEFLEKARDVLCSLLFWVKLARHVLAHTILNRAWSTSVVGNAILPSWKREGWRKAVYGLEMENEVVGHGLGLSSGRFRYLFGEIYLQLNNRWTCASRTQPQDNGYSVLTGSFFLENLIKGFLRRLGNHCGKHSRIQNVTMLSDSWGSVYIYSLDSEANPPTSPEESEKVTVFSLLEPTNVHEYWRRRDTKK